MTFGCCASTEDVDDGRAPLRDHGESESHIIYDQPQTVPRPCANSFHHARPSTSQSMSRHVSQWVNNSRDFATRASSRASFSTLTRPRRSHSVHKIRPSISGPTNFQHLDNGIEFDGFQSMINDAPLPIRRNRSFRRLELSIYLPDGCGRLSPLPDFTDDEDWGASKTKLTKPAHALVRLRDSRTNSLSSNPSAFDFIIPRKPVGSSTAASVAHSRRSSVQSQKSNGTTTTHERRLSGTTMATIHTTSLSMWPEEPQSSSNSIFEKPVIRRSNTSGTLSSPRVLSRLPSPSRTRSNTAPTRPGSLRRMKTDVDEAIRELNTIVEERRASAYRSQTQAPALINRPPPSPSHHVPYIAPSMRMRVRSETLNDIGSAFSASVSYDKALPVLPTTRSRTTGLALALPSRDSTMALSSNPITPTGSQLSSNSMSCLTTWFKRSISASTTPTSPSATKLQDPPPFYKCDPSTSRPSTAGSHTVYHSRQDSQESNTTAHATLFSASSSPTSRSTSPNSTPRKAKRVPAPLNLAKDKEMEIVVEDALQSARSLKLTPNYNLLKGMEITAKEVNTGLNGERRSFVPSPSAVGVAF